jgi:hypothetical protein
MMSRASISEVTGGVRRRRIAGSRRRGRRARHVGGRGPAIPSLAIVVQGGTVQGVYAEQRGRCTVHLLDYDDLRADDGLAEGVATTGMLPELAVEPGLATAVAEYRAVAAHQARHRPAVEIGS